MEINIDVYPTREKELVERTGSSSVPQIFFNEKLFGGLVVLNSMRNSGLLEQKLKEMLGRKCPDDAPALPVYGFDDPDDEDERADEMVQIVRVLRQRLPIQDRLMKMKIVKNCFAGAELVEVVVLHLDCGRKKVRRRPENYDSGIVYQKANPKKKSVVQIISDSINHNNQLHI